jgi:hypothetical protein
MTPTHMTTGPRPPPLPQRCVGEEAGRVDGRPVDLLSLDQVTNLGTDSVPDTIGRGVEDSADRLDGDVGVSTDGLEEGRSEEVRTVDEVRVVVVPGDAVIICRSLVLVGAVHGESGGIAGEGEGGEIGPRSRVAQGRGAGHARRAGAPVSLALEVNTLESKWGEFWTGGGKCSIDTERS